jgi:CrcB protein
MPYLIVFVGAGIGGSLRHFVNVMTAHLGNPSWVGTLAINVTGSFAIGLIAEYFALRGHLPQEWRLFVVTGIIGGYTTFSAFSLETVLLYESGHMVAGFGYVLSSVVLSLTATFSALLLLRYVLRS